MCLFRLMFRVFDNFLAHAADLLTPKRNLVLSGKTDY